MKSARMRCPPVALEIIDRQNNEKKERLVKSRKRRLQVPDVEAAKKRKETPTPAKL